MKTKVQILCKCFLIVFFLSITSFSQSVKQMIVQQSLFSHGMEIHATSMVYESEEEKAKQIQDEAITQPSNSPLIYIYNTHQNETYRGGESVYQAALYLAERLQQLGFQVVVESGDFQAYGRENGLDYNYSYQISRSFINDAIMEYGGFDYMIDFHRDAVPYESSILVGEDGRTYAKLMCVVGGLGEYAYEIGKMASTISDNTNRYLPGIMKNTMTREAVYNQDLSESMILIENGSDTNSFEEVQNSLDILAKGLADSLR